MGQGAQHRLADVRKRFSWWDQQPALSLTIFPTRDGLKLSMRYTWRGGRGQMETKTLLESVWSPREVTEEKIVSWAQRGLSTYLAQNLSEYSEPSDR